MLKGSQFIIDPEKLGYETCAYIGLYLQNPAKFDDVVDELKKIPEVVECHYTTGGFDMFIKIYARNNHHLLNIIHDKLQPLGLSRSETIISFNAIIDRQLPIGELPVCNEFFCVYYRPLALSSPEASGLSRPVKSGVPYKEMFIL